MYKYSRKEYCMFKNNKYCVWYFNIVNKAKCDRDLDYSEKHHIIPKCIGGEDSPENIVKLTSKEHFICHMLLTKMHDSNSLKYAFWAMSLVNPHQCRYRITSNQYSYLKLCNSIATKERMSGHYGYNTGKVMAWKGTETKFFNKGIPEGWTRGHNPNTKKNMLGKNSGKVYYHNPETGDVKTFSSPPPSPWTIGNPNADTSALNNIKGSSYFHDPDTGEETRCLLKDAPDGWKKGRSVIWINDGKSSKQHNKVVPIPNGWKKGRILKWKPR